MSNCGQKTGNIGKQHDWLHLFIKLQHCSNQCIVSVYHQDVDVIEYVDTGTTERLSCNHPIITTSSFQDSLGCRKELI